MFARLKRQYGRSDKNLFARPSRHAFPVVARRDQKYQLISVVARTDLGHTITRALLRFNCRDL